MLTCCLMFTILSVLVMGIGIGFHYCFVQHSVNTMCMCFTFVYTFSCLLSECIIPKYHQNNCFIGLFVAAKGSARSGAARSGPESQIPVMRSVNPAVKNDFLHRMTREAAKPPLTNERENISNITENLKLGFDKQNLSIIEKNFTTHSLNLGSNFTKFPL